MKIPSLDDLLLLPESEALQRYLDGRNWRILRGTLAIALLVSLFGVAGTLDEGKPLAFSLYLLDLAATIALFASRKEPWFERHFLRLQTAYLLLQNLAWSPLILGVHRGPQMAGLLPWVFLMLRLRFADALLLYGVYWALSSLPLAALGIGVQTRFDGGRTAGAVVLLAFCLIWTRVAKKRFLTQWRRDHHRARERLRMQEEIETARRVQLSMLPQSPPVVEWLELAAASLPATQVGGNYYDYFRLAPSQVALVVGDVAGHGLASGLLLSGVRSCLYILEDQLASPARVLEQLSPMVRRTTDRQMYVTLLAAVLDHEAGSFAVASAGHPPLLWRGPAGWEDLGRPASPLGTVEDAHYEVETRPSSHGDVLVLYTEGLIKARDAAGRDYGRDRLVRALDRAGKGARAAEIREAVLSDLSLFRGGAETEDDITLVVARVV
ncbi:MAG TPA: PP2C family protein-serine/threonine phosphatase [Thermoanaerobaculia bacterium]|nr:PP2C family protein-serine/threonine phosphatase [Thermoanaerobaculia bacterium]